MVYVGAFLVCPLAIGIKLLSTILFLAGCTSSVAEKFLLLCDEDQFNRWTNLMSPREEGHDTIVELTIMNLFLVHE